MASIPYILDQQSGRPESVQAEVTILGAILLEPLAILDVTARLREQDFSLDSHRRIYAAMLELIKRNHAVDLITVGEELRKRKDIEAIGGPAYIASLTEGLPRNLSVENYVRIVKDKAMLRALQGVGDFITTAAGDSGSVGSEVAQEAHKRLESISEGGIENDLMDLGAVVESSFASIDELWEAGQEITGLETHFTEFDRMTCGLQKSELIIIAAKPSMGKTALSINIAQSAALKDGKKIAIFSLEMSKEFLLRRMVSSEAWVDSQAIKKGKVDDHERIRLRNALGALVGSKLFIDDTPGITLTEMRAKAHKMKRKEGLDLIVVDYLQLMGTEGKYENRTQAVSAISRGLKVLAKHLNVPVIALSQLSRGDEHGRKPRLSDLRESGSIEQDADVVAFIHRESYYNKNEHGEEDPATKWKAEIILAKQRNGPVGSIWLGWRDKFTRFENLSTNY